MSSTSIKSVPARPDVVDYTIVMSYSFSNEWRALGREARHAFEAEHVFPILARYRDRLVFRSYDADAFTTRTSDFMIFETQDLSAFYYLVEELRDSQFLALGYAAITDVLIGINNEYKRAAPLEAAA